MSEFIGDTPANLDNCDVCGCPVSNGMGRHKYAAGCIKALSGYVQTVGQKLDAIQELFVSHGDAIAKVIQDCDQAKQRMDIQSDNTSSVIRTLGNQTKWLNELNSRLTVHEARHNDAREEEQDSDQIVRAKQEGYSQGYTDAVRRFSRAVKEVIGDDSLAS